MWTETRKTKTNSPRQTTRMPEMLGTPVPPSVVFHGTGLPFEVFAPNARGIFFAERYSAATPYSRIHRGAQPRVVAAALAITHPWVQITYPDDVPYSARVDQSVAAVAARGYDGIYVPEGRAWIAVHPEQVTIVESDVQRSAFVPHLQAAVDDAELGFHFEEDGCWGMALALKAVLGGDLVLRDGFTHAYLTTSRRSQAMSYRPSSATHSGDCPPWELPWPRRRTLDERGNAIVTRQTNVLLRIGAIPFAQSERALR